jgi:hypothetical protein
LFEQLNSQQGIAFVRIVLATLHWRRQAYIEAAQELDLARAIVEDEGVEEFRVDIGRWLAQMALSQGEAERALHFVEPWLGSVDEEGDEGLEPLYWIQAQAWALLGMLGQAVAILLASYGLLQTTDSPYQTAHVLLALGQVLAGQNGRQAEARAHAQAALTTFIQLGARLDAAEADKLLAILATED